MPISGWATHSPPVSESNSRRRLGLRCLSGLETWPGSSFGRDARGTHSTASFRRAHPTVVLSTRVREHGPATRSPVPDRHCFPRRWRTLTKAMPGRAPSIRKAGANLQQFEVPDDRSWRRSQDLDHARLADCRTVSPSTRCRHRVATPSPACCGRSRKSCDRGGKGAVSSDSILGERQPRRRARSGESIWESQLMRAC